MVKQASKQVSINSIVASIENDEIYGEIDPTDIDLVNLANDIQANGVLEPIQVSTDNYVLSGHRRLAASRLVGLKTIPVSVQTISRFDYTDSEWKEKLIAYNRQRVKSDAVRLKEVMATIDPDIAYEQLKRDREQRESTAPPRIRITGIKTRSSISERKLAMLYAAKGVVADLRIFWPLTVRQIHYRLLNNPPLRNSSMGSQRSMYENNLESYNDLCNLLTRARLSGDIAWEAITDSTRATQGLRYSKDVASFVDLATHNFLRGYHRDLLQSQPDHIELVIEKLTVNGIISPIANEYCLPMTTGRGYCSLDPRNEIASRFKQSGKDRMVLLFCSDFDPDGEEIAESFVKSIRDDFGVRDVAGSKILLRQDQVKRWKLPSNEMEAKVSSSNYKKFIKRYKSTDVFELEAVDPRAMQDAVRDGIEASLNMEKFYAEVEHEKQDAAVLQAMKIEVAKALPRCGGAT